MWIPIRLSDSVVTIHSVWVLPSLPKSAEVANLSRKLEAATSPPLCGLKPRYIDSL